MADETIEFLAKVTASHSARTAFINKLFFVANRIIPIISSYAGITGEDGSIISQEKDLRGNFGILAFRCLSLNALRDLPEFLKVAKKNDYIFIDWEETEFDLDDLDQQEIIELLRLFPCSVITHRNPFPSTLTNSGLMHGELIESIDNSLIDNYKKYGGTCLSDFAGIKKDFSEGAPIISPGFIYYDAVENGFYGFKYKSGGHKKGETSPDISEFETTIIPAVIASEATKRMLESPLDYLNKSNKGWAIIKRIELGKEKGGESGQLAAKFKRIGMEHYLFSMRTKILSGYFD